MQTPVHVLHLLTTIIPNGGVQKLILGYAEQVSRHGVIFDYVAQGQGDPELEQRCRDDGSQIFYVPEMTKHPIGFTKALYQLLRAHPEYRIIHVHQNFLNFIPLLTAKAAKTDVRISHSHNSYATSRLKKLVRGVSRFLIQRTATELWGCSKLAYGWLYGKPFAESPHIYILHNAIDASRFAFLPERRAALRCGAGLQDEFVCICVANLSALKNQSLLLDAMKALQAAQPERPVVLWLVGEGSIRPALEEKCRQLGLESSVRFLGRRTDVPELLLQADCFLLPSHAEGLPVSVVEAQMSGLPCILSANITREVALRDDVVFLDIGDGNVPAWARQILTFSRMKIDRETPLPQDCGYDIEKEGEKLAAKYKALAAAAQKNG